MSNEFKCQKCGSDTELSGCVRCWCDKDFCMGQRCGADYLHAHYKCKNKDCRATGTPPDTESYYQRHMPKD